MLYIYSIAIIIAFSFSEKGKNSNQSSKLSQSFWPSLQNSIKKMSDIFSSSSFFKLIFFSKSAQTIQILVWFAWSEFWWRETNFTKNWEKDRNKEKDIRLSLGKWNILKFNSNMIKISWKVSTKNAKKDVFENLDYEWGESKVGNQ